MDYWDPNIPKPTHSKVIKGAAQTNMTDAEKIESLYAALETEIQARQKAEEGLTQLIEAVSKGVHRNTSALIDTIQMGDENNTRRIELWKSQSQVMMDRLDRDLQDLTTEVTSARRKMLLPVGVAIVINTVVQIVMRLTS